MDSTTIWSNVARTAIAKADPLGADNAFIASAINEGHAGRLGLQYQNNAGRPLCTWMGQMVLVLLSSSSESRPSVELHAG